MPASPRLSNGFLSRRSQTPKGRSNGRRSPSRPGSPGDPRGQEAERRRVIDGATRRHRLRDELDRIPLWRGNHVGVKQLCEDMARYLYLPRLRDDDILLGAIRDGLSQLTWQSDTFAFAAGWDEKRSRYQGLKAGKSMQVLVDSECLLVKPEMAATQLAADEAEANASGSSGEVPSSLDKSGSSSATVAGKPESKTTTTSGAEPPRQMRRFHGSVRLDAIRLGRDASRIADEVVQHLAGIVGSDVKITLEIHCELPDGASEKLVRDITENCRTLNFEDYGFEEA